MHETGIKAFSDMERFRKVALPFLRKICLVKGRGKVEKRWPGGQERGSSTGGQQTDPQDHSHAPAHRAAHSDW